MANPALIFAKILALVPPGRRLVVDPSRRLDAFVDRREGGNEGRALPFLGAKSRQDLAYVRIRHDFIAARAIQARLILRDILVKAILESRPAMADLLERNRGVPVA